MRPLIPVLFVACLTASCTFANIPKNSQVTVSEKETVLIVGISPDYSIGISHAPIIDNVFTKDSLSVFDARLSPSDDYIVIKVASRPQPNAYAIMQIITHPPEGEGGAAFVPCDGDKAIVFEAPPGKVIYIGDINYQWSAARREILNYSHSVNFEKAKQFLKTNHPSLADKVEAQEIKYLPVRAGMCNTGATMFISGKLIYIPNIGRTSVSPDGTYYEH